LQWRGAKQFLGAPVPFVLLLLQHTITRDAGLQGGETSRPNHQAGMVLADGWDVVGCHLRSGMDGQTEAGQ